MKPKSAAGGDKPPAALLTGLVCRQGPVIHIGDVVRPVGKLADFRAGNARARREIDRVLGVPGTGYGLVDLRAAVFAHIDRGMACHAVFGPDSECVGRVRGQAADGLEDGVVSSVVVSVVGSRMGAGAVDAEDCASSKPVTEGSGFIAGVSDEIDTAAGADGIRGRSDRAVGVARSRCNRLDRLGRADGDSSGVSGRGRCGGGAVGGVVDGRSRSAIRECHRLRRGVSPACRRERRGRHRRGDAAGVQADEQAIAARGTWPVKVARRIPILGLVECVARRAAVGAGAADLGSSELGACFVELDFRYIAPASVGRQVTQIAVGSSVGDVQGCPGSLGGLNRNGCQSDGSGETRITASLEETAHHASRPTGTRIVAHTADAARAAAGIDGVGG